LNQLAQHHSKCEPDAADETLGLTALARQNARIGGVVRAKKRRPVSGVVQPVAEVSMQQAGALTTGVVFLFLGAILIGFL